MEAPAVSRLIAWNWANRCMIRPGISPRSPPRSTVRRPVHRRDAESEHTPGIRRAQWTPLPSQKGAAGRLSSQPRRVAMKRVIDRAAYTCVKGDFGQCDDCGETHLTRTATSPIQIHDHSAYRAGIISLCRRGLIQSEACTKGERRCPDCDGGTFKSLPSFLTSAFKGGRNYGNGAEPRSDGTFHPRRLW